MENTQGTRAERHVECVSVFIGRRAVYTAFVLMTLVERVGGGVLVELLLLCIPRRDVCVVTVPNE